jgi:glycosyltransferase involved in cell wall biosynthesis
LTQPDGTGEDGSPAVSIVMAVLNAADTVGEQIAGLAGQQTDLEWELIVVDNGCTDDTIRIVTSTSDLSDRLKIVDARSEQSVAYARNRGVEAARAPIIAFCDGDDVVDPQWLTRLYEAVATADLVGGALEVDRLNSPEAIYWRGGAPTVGGLPIALGFLPSIIGANFAVRRDRYLAVGGCDEGMGYSCDDVDLAWRLQQAGARLAFADSAIVHYRLRSSARGQMRQQWHYGSAEARLRKKFGSVVRRDSVSAVASSYWFLVSRLHHVVRGRRLRGRWLGVLAYRAGRLKGAFANAVLWW